MSASLKTQKTQIIHRDAKGNFINTDANLAKTNIHQKGAYDIHKNVAREAFLPKYIAHCKFQIEIHSKKNTVQGWYEN